MSAAEATVASANEESAALAETATEGGARATEEEARAGADGGEVRVERRGDETRKGAARETEGAEAEAQTRERVRSEDESFRRRSLFMVLQCSRCNEAKKCCVMLINISLRLTTLQ